MKKVFLLFILCTFGLCTNLGLPTTPAMAGTNHEQSDNSLLVNKNPAVTARLIANTKAIVPGEPFKLGVELTMKPGWHTYYKDPGDAGMPTKIVWKLPPGFRNSSLYWEKPTRFEEAGITTYGYTNKTLIAITVIPPNNLKPTDALNLSGQVKWLSCKDLCVPGGSEVHLTLPVFSPTRGKSLKLADNTKAFAAVDFTDPIPQVSKKNDSNNNNSIDLLDVPKQTQAADSGRILYYFAFALIGGFLLNFMPCVLPVVAIKLLSLLEQPNKESTRRTVIAFSSGILSSFLLLGILVIGLQAAGQKIGWGFQFQQPIFLMCMSSLVLLFALSLLGLFDFSLSFGQKTVDNLAEHEGFIGDFFKGVLATILSTPCTAPFLGTALGFAFVEPWIVTLSIFAAVGIGMCLPYLVLIIAPQYLRFLPKPGDWMAKLKESFGFIMLATVIWFLSILYYQIPAAAVIAFMYFLLSVAFAIWLMNRFTNLASSTKRTLIVRSIASLIVICSAYIFIFQNKDLVLNGTVSNTTNAATSTNSEDSKSFDLTALNNALNSGKTVFLDFGAKWCLTCQLNETAVIDTQTIQDKFHALNVVFIKADWTRQDPTVTKLLRKFERSGVPFYVIFPGKSPNTPIILPEILTPDLVLRKLDEAGPSIDKSQK